MAMTLPVRFGAWCWNPNTLELSKGSYVATLEPRVARLFEYLLAHPGELLSHDRIVEVVWDGRAISDEAVRRAVFNLRQAFAVDAGAEGYIRTVHKKGYVASFPARLPAEPDPREGSSEDPLPGADPGEDRAAAAALAPIDPGPAAAATPPRQGVLLLLAGALLLLVVVVARFDGRWMTEVAPDPASNTESLPTGPAAIAVLPFTNLSEEADTEFLADGLAEELMGALARNRALRVTARGSAFQFRGQERDAREVGRQLGVRYVLEGSVRKSAQQVRIHARLVDAGTGMQLWSEAYDRTLADWFALQQELAAEVARALDLALHRDDAGRAPGATVSVEAHLEVLRARQLIASRSVADAEQAIEHLQRALALDPEYAVAHARLADAIMIKALSTTGVEAARPIAAPLLDSALALDPALGEAYALRSMLTDDAAVAERDLRRGLELNPSYARGYELLAKLQAASPDKEPAVTSIDHAIALDPLTPGNFHTKAMLMVEQGNYPAAAALDRRALELNPQFRSSLAQLGLMLAVEGDFADAIGYAERAVALDPRAVPLQLQLMGLYLAIDDIESARAVNTPPTPIGQLVLLAGAGELSQAAAMIYSKEFVPIGQFVPELVSQIALGQARSDGDFSRARALVSAALQFTDSVPPETHGWRLYAYANLVQLLVASGDTNAAARLERQIEERMRTTEARYPRYALLHDQVRATQLAHAGRAEDACAALERTYARAPRMFWMMVLSNPAFAGMQAMPRFRDLLTRIKAHVAAERVRVDAMRRAGQIPDRSIGTSQAGARTAS